MMKPILKEDEKKKGDILINGLRRALEKKRRLDLHRVYMYVFEVWRMMYTTGQ